MPLKSQAYRSDLQLIAEMGRVDARADYHVARTPENPGFYWGNFVLFPKAPQAGDLALWMRVFEKEFGHERAIRHVAFGWDDVSGDEGAARSPEWQARGFEVVRSDVLQALPFELVPPEPGNPNLELRPILAERDWQAVLELQIRTGGAGFDPGEFRDFKTRRMRGYRKLVDADRGRWYGAFLGDHLVGDLGLFTFDGCVRYQMVETHPDYRRQGIARHLMYFAAHDFMAGGDADELLIVGEEASRAAQIYGSLGFRAVEKQLGAVALKP